MTMQGIDHVIIVAPDLDATRDEFQDLGFTVSPRNVHPHFGTANHIVVFDQTYIELIGVENDAPEDRFGIDMFADQLERGGDLMVLALRTSDAAKDRDALLQRGLSLAEVSTWQRAANLEDDSAPIAGFRTTGIPRNATPGAGFIFCEHLTPELIWRSEWQHHGNGAAQMLGVTRPTRDTSDPVASCFANVFGKANVVQRSLGLRVELGGGHWLQLLESATEVTLSLAGKREFGKTALQTVAAVSIECQQR